MPLSSLSTIVMVIVSLGDSVLPGEGVNCPVPPREARLQTA
jgi:hypothetical protein